MARTRSPSLGMREARHTLVPSDELLWEGVRATARSQRIRPPPSLSLPAEPADALVARILQPELLVRPVRRAHTMLSLALRERLAAPSEESSEGMRATAHPQLIRPPPTFFSAPELAHTRVARILNPPLMARPA